MCLLSYYPPGVLPVREHLENGAAINPHGSGYAMPLDGIVIRMRSLAAQPVIDEFMAMRRHYPRVPALFHSRYASATAATLETCHPLRIGHGRDMVAHNGYLFTSPDGRSDTQVLADDILPHWDLDDAGDRAELEALMGLSRAVVITADGRGIVLNENAPGTITLADGTWHSNTGYTGVPPVEPGTCAVCGQPLSTGRICAECQAGAETRRLAMTERIGR
jgi:glutamine amidotransferase